LKKDSESRFCFVYIFIEWLDLELCQLLISSNKFNIVSLSRPSIHKTNRKVIAHFWCFVGNKVGVFGRIVLTVWIELTQFKLLLLSV